MIEPGYHDHAGGAESLTDALARWTTQLWHCPEEPPASKKAMICYIDGHRKPVYSDTLIPRGLVGRLGAILGCRALVLLHDEQGHPLLATTHRGDQHLTRGVPSIVARYEHNEEGHILIERIIVDREGMATEFLASLHADGLAQTYIRRWPVQENVIKDYLLPLGLDTNHGFAKTPVENSEVSKQRTQLQERLTRLKQWAQSASKQAKTTFQAFQKLVKNPLQKIQILPIRIYRRKSI